jgi:hypothetical protein
MMSKILRSASPIVFLIVAACGGNPPPSPAQPSVPKTAEPVDVAPPAAPSVDADAGTADAAASPPKKGGSGRPQAIYNGVSEPQTVGLDGAVFRTDDGAELRLGGGWYNAPRNIIFLIDKKGKGTTGALGALYMIHVQMPDTQFRMGEETPSQSVQTQADPFVIKLPLPKGTESANLAIETIAVDAKTKKNKSSWAVVGMTKMESSDAGNKAVFEVNTLPDGRVHLTSQAPTPGAPTP